MMDMRNAFLWECPLEEFLTPSWSQSEVAGLPRRQYGSIWNILTSNHSNALSLGTQPLRGQHSP